MAFGFGLGFGLGNGLGYGLGGATKKKSKKKKGGKSKKKKGASTKKTSGLMNEILASYTEIPPEAFITDHMVTVHIRLLNWDYLDFDIKVSEDTKLYVIAQRIIERHGGSVERLQLWRDQVKPHLQLTDMTESLNDVFEFEEILPPNSLQETIEPSVQDLLIKEGAAGEVDPDDGIESGAVDEIADGDVDDEEAEGDSSEQVEMKKKRKKSTKKGKKKKRSLSKKKKKKSEEIVKPAAPVKPVVEYECVIYYDFECHQSTDPLLAVEPLQMEEPRVKSALL